MAKRGKTDLITFIAEYDDGSKQYFQIDSFTLRSGDAISRIVAGEWQAGGRLKEGNISRTYRAPPGEQFTGPIVGH